jgi:serine phosphatase RsbU (regulator of sigma subunit)
LLYTDGLTDPPAAGFGEREIVEVLESRAADSAQRVAQALYDARFEATPPTDDVIVLCVKRRQRG